MRPSGTGTIATDSLRTHLLRLISPHVEHRLFLSATPHNGYESSYSALLELLDPQRFARGVRPAEAALRRSVVRRMKSQIQDEIDAKGGTTRFPRRIVRALGVRYGKDERDAHAALEAYSRSRRNTSSNERGAVAADLTTLLLQEAHVLFTCGIRIDARSPPRNAGAARGNAIRKRNAMRRLRGTTKSTVCRRVSPSWTTTSISTTISTKRRATRFSKLRASAALRTPNSSRYSNACSAGAMPPAANPTPKQSVSCARWNAGAAHAAAIGAARGTTSASRLHRIS